MASSGHRNCFGDDRPPPPPTNLTRYDSTDEFSQSGLGDFNNGALSSALDKSKKHFDWGKAKVVRMSDTDGVDGLAEDLNGFSFPCDTTALSSGTSKTLSSSESSSSADSGKKPKKSRSRTNDGKSSRISKNTRSASPKMCKPRTRLGNIPESEIRENTDVEECCNDLDDVHCAINEDWQPFGNDIRRSSAPSTMLRDTMALAFGQSAFPDRRMTTFPLKLCSDDEDDDLFDSIVVKRRTKSNDDMPIFEDSSLTPKHKTPRSKSSDDMPAFQDAPSTIRRHKNPRSKSSDDMPTFEDASPTPRHKPPRSKSSDDMPTFEDASPTPRHKPPREMTSHEQQEIVFVPRLEDFAQNQQSSSHSRTPTDKEVTVQINQLLQNNPGLRKI